MSELQQFISFLKKNHNIDLNNEYKEFKSQKCINIYTDGATPNNAKSKKLNLPGGIGIWSQEANISVSERYENATNNKMELKAISRALEIIENKELNKNIIIWSDSVYSIKCITIWYKKWEKNGWKTSNGSDVENQEMIKEIVEKLKKNTNVEIKYVKGHSDNIGNQKADELATSAV